MCFVDVVHKLNDSFDTGKTELLSGVKPVKGIRNFTERQPARHLTGLRNDLGKCKTEAMVAEQGFLLSDIKHTLKYLDKWAKPRKVSTPMVAWPGKSFRKPELLGTVLIIGAWNYPLQLLLAPYIVAVAAATVQY